MTKTQPNIKLWTPTQIMRKESFRRAMPGTFPVDVQRKGNPDYETNRLNDPIKYTYPTQDDFLREYDPASHAINSIKYYPNQIFMDKQTGHFKTKIRSRVSIAWQRRIHVKRVVALTGFDPDLSLPRSKTDIKSLDLLKMYKEGWALKNMDSVVHLAISSDLKVGDVAVCGYKSKGVFGTRIFSYDRGDTLYPHYDPMTGRPNFFGRMFSVTMTNPKDSTQFETIKYLDVWDDLNYMQHRTLASWEKSKNPGADEWIVSVEPKPHGFREVPVAYHRYGEPCWAGSQSLIEQNELTFSQLSENNAQFALRILYSLGAEFEMETSQDGTPMQISSTDPNAKIGFLESAEKSTSYETELNKQEKEIMRCSFAVETPEIKSGSDISSLTVKTMMQDSYVKALDDSKIYQDFLDDICRIFAEGYGTEIGKEADITGLGVKAKLQPWVFMSETECVNTVVQLVSIGVLSKRSAVDYIYETLGMGSVDEAERVFQEEHDRLVQENSIVQNANA